MATNLFEETLLPFRVASPAGHVVRIRFHCPLPGLRVPVIASGEGKVFFGLNQYHFSNFRKRPPIVIVQPADTRVTAKSWSRVRWGAGHSLYTVAMPRAPEPIEDMPGNPGCRPERSQIADCRQHHEYFSPADHSGQPNPCSATGKFGPVLKTPVVSSAGNSHKTCLFWRELTEVSCFLRQVAT